MSIEDDPQILVGKPHMELSNDDVARVAAFIRANQELLLQLGNKKITIKDFLQKMKKGGK